MRSGGLRNNCTRCVNRAKSEAFKARNETSHSRIQVRASGGACIAHSIHKTALLNLNARPKAGLRQLEISSAQRQKLSSTPPVSVVTSRACHATTSKQPIYGGSRNSHSNLRYVPSRELTMFKPSPVFIMQRATVLKQGGCGSFEAPVTHPLHHSSELGNLCAEQRRLIAYHNRDG